MTKQRNIKMNSLTTDEARMRFGTLTIVQIQIPNDEQLVIEFDNGEQITVWANADEELMYWVSRIEDGQPR